MIVHHPDEAILLDYGAGNLPEALALVVAAHLSLCSLCSACVRLIELCGADLLDGAPEDSMSEHALDDLLGRLDTIEPVVARQTTSFDSETEGLLPAPLRRYVRGNIVDLDWRPLGASIEEYRLPLPRKDVRAALYRLPAASVVPTHTHWGREYALVLTGRYRDNDKQFGRGDFSAMDESTSHQPFVEADGPCICLAGIDGPIKFSGAARFFLNLTP